MFEYRFSERDLLLRYHWGLGIGHIHAHQAAATSEKHSQLAECEWQEEEETDQEILEGNSDVYNSGDSPGLGSEDDESEGWDSSSNGDDESGIENEETEEYFTGV
jgi:L-alanine-DL-glutamate epimerase-like enolase superfamily enzyme